MPVHELPYPCDDGNCAFCADMADIFQQLRLLGMAEAPAADIAYELAEARATGAGNRA